MMIGSGKIEVSLTENSADFGETHFVVPKRKPNQSP